MVASVVAGGIVMWLWFVSSGSFVSVLMVRIVTMRM